MQLAMQFARSNQKYALRFSLTYDKTTKLKLYLNTDTRDRAGHGTANSYSQSDPTGRPKGSYTAEKRGRSDCAASCPAPISATQASGSPALLGPKT
jgi:hypothetical protein